ncbi:hypothetical protein ZWY2020_046625 [Hordeum vulgare]|nr:hypothetical protein ZWY2020_046625 [Hordeum vulgare]
MKNAAAGEANLVKVRMDGVPYMHEVNLAAYSNYPGLFGDLNIIYNCCSIGMVVKGGIAWEHTVVFLDADDGMLVGDLPWKDFKSSCKEMRVMRTCDAKP